VIFSAKKLEENFAWKTEGKNFLGIFSVKILEKKSSKNKGGIRICLIITPLDN
jgi:hypothetical protein